MVLDVLTPEQVAGVLGCEPEHVNSLAASHRLPAVKFGRSWRFPSAALARYLDEQATAHLQRPVSPIRAPKVVPVPKRGKQRPDLMRAAQQAGLSTDDQLNLIHGATRTA
ncbi:helix-turn-helix domain-containing protein [Ralstonia thomasii]|uniref:helix-turn-helix domain-containing protein n=1 Tax=Ralstonia thomasii TaxID=3058596 RepID=UPI003D177ED1